MPERATTPSANLAESRYINTLSNNMIPCLRSDQLKPVEVMLSQEMESRIRAVCHQMARKTLGSESTDILETVGERFCSCALEFVKRAVWMKQDPDTVLDALHYAEAVLAHGMVGGSVEWLRATLDALLEPIMPSREVTPDALPYLLRAQAALVGRMT